MSDGSPSERALGKRRVVDLTNGNDGAKDERANKKAHIDVTQDDVMKDIKVHEVDEVVDITETRHPHTNYEHPGKHAWKSFPLGAVGWVKYDAFGRGKFHFAPAPVSDQAHLMMRTSRKTGRLAFLLGSDDLDFSCEVPVSFEDGRTIFVIQRIGGLDEDGNVYIQKIGFYDRTSPETWLDLCGLKTTLMYEDLEVAE